MVLVTVIAMAMRKVLLIINKKLKVVLVVVVLIVVAIVFRYPNPGSLSKPKKMDAVSQISWEQPSGETRWETRARARIWSK